MSKRQRDLRNQGVRMGRRALSRSALLSGAAALQLLCAPAGAFELSTGNSDVQVRWDNTFKYSAAARVKGRSEGLVSPGTNNNNVNLDDGDRNFSKGLISNRIDWLSEFDVTYQSMGLRLSGAAWYDRIYQRSTHNNNPFTSNHQPANEFPADTRSIHGRKAELLDAFVFGAADVGDARVAGRLGRHGLVWGETLFFGANGIAGGMMPVDVIKLVSVPNTLFKEAIRPVPMVSGSLQLSSGISLGAYYQFRWEASRIPQVGSYFSQGDTIPGGSEQMLLAGLGSPFSSDAPRQGDWKPKHSGQGGLQLRGRWEDTDLGAYFQRYHAKAPQQVVNLGVNGVAVGPVSYRLFYPQGISAFGISASHTFGGLNLAAEASVRHNQPLISGLSADPSALVGSLASNGSDNPAYPVAKTAHFNVSGIWSLPRTPLFEEGNVVFELGWNRVLSVTKSVQSVDPAASRDAVAMRALFQPTYRQVMVGLDLTPVLGLGWAPRGSRSSITTAEMPQNGNGDMTLGLNAAYEDVWNASLAFTHYYGSQGSWLSPTNAAGQNTLAFKQYYADRDFISLSLRRSF